MLLFGRAIARRRQRCLTAGTLLVLVVPPLILLGPLVRSIFRLPTILINPTKFNLDFVYVCKRTLDSSVFHRSIRLQIRLDLTLFALIRRDLPILTLVI